MTADGLNAALLQFCIAFICAIAASVLVIVYYPNRPLLLAINSFLLGVNLMLTWINWRLFK